MRILLVDSISSPINQSNVRGLIGAYQSVGAVRTFDYRAINKKLGKAAMNQALISSAANFNPALIHLEKCEQLLGNTVKQLRQVTSAKIVHVFPDYRPNIPKYVKDICPYVDWSLYPHAGTHWAKQCREAGAKRLGFWTRGVDPRVFQLYQAEKKYSLTMLANRAGNPATGTGQGDRGKFLQYLNKAGLGVHLFGTGNVKYARSREGIQAHNHVDLEEYSKVVAATKVGLAYNIENVPMYCSWRRIFNTLACKGFLLIRYFTGLEKVFKNKEHLVWFRSLEEAAALAKFYIINPELRDAIATRGQEEVLQYHTWDIRVERMINLAFKNLDSPKFARF